VTVVDLVVIVFVVGLASWGFRQGALIGVSSLVGFAIGTMIGTRLAGAILEQGAQSPYTPLFGLVGGLAIGAATSEVTMAIGIRVRKRFTSRTAHRVDGSLGAVLFGTFALAIIWIGAAAVQQARVSPELSSAVRKSALVQQLNAALPPSGPVLGALRTVDPFPSISGPAAGVDDADPGVINDPEIRAASNSVVRVIGSACGFGVQGSGWVVSPDLVVTNAHVAAGTDEISVQSNFANPVFSRVVWFDPVNDLALLAAPGLGLAPIPYEGGETEKVSGAVLGYPEDGPFDAQPARIGTTENVYSRDIYEKGPVRRPMTAFRAVVRHGNSGGPIVDERGIARATVFASSVNRPGEGYAVPIEQLHEALQQVNTTVPVGTGPCT
jgi:S1-C subfamily serine protease